MEKLEPIILTEDFLKKFSRGQQALLTTLAKYPNGIKSRDLAHESAVSNKSEAINKLHVKLLLEKEGLYLDIRRLEKKGQWLWSLKRIEKMEVSDANYVDSVSFS